MKQFAVEEDVADENVDAGKEESPENADAAEDLEDETVNLASRQYASLGVVRYSQRNRQEDGRSAVQKFNEVIRNHSLVDATKDNEKTLQEKNYFSLRNGLVVRYRS